MYTFQKVLLHNPETKIDFLKLLIDAKKKQLQKYKHTFIERGQDRLKKDMGHTKQDVTATNRIDIYTGRYK